MNMSISYLYRPHAQCAEHCLPLPFSMQLLPRLLHFMELSPFFHYHDSCSYIFPSLDPGVDATSSLIIWFWEVMEELTNQERSLFLRFVWGRTRLPRTIADFRGRDFVLQVLDKYNPPDHFLPESYTCFFLLKMPRYSCKAVRLRLMNYFIHESSLHSLCKCRQPVGFILFGPGEVSSSSLSLVLPFIRTPHLSAHLSTRPSIPFRC